MNRSLAIVFAIGVVVLIIAEAIYLIPIITSSDNTTNEIESVFNINQIHYYSDIGIEVNDVTYQNSEWNLDVYQYTDIAIYLERIVDYDISNYIKNIYIDNIEILESKKGSQKLYYLNPLNFGSSELTDELEGNEIIDKLEYNIMNYENEEDDVKYSIPIFFEDCSNPITIRYMNYDILENYTVSSTETLEFNGSILKNAGIKLEDISSKITLTINVVTKDEETHSVNLELEVPLVSNEVQIYDGGIDFVKENIENYF